MRFLTNFLSLLYTALVWITLAILIPISYVVQGISNTLLQITIALMKDLPINDE